MRSHCRWLMVVAIGSCYFAAASIHAGGQTEKPAELKVLEHYVGDWDVTVNTAGLPFAKGNVTAKMVLDGTYLEQFGQLQSADGKVVYSMKTLMTYDSDAKRFRSWTFSSDGGMSPAEATWDMGKKHMTSTSKKRADGTYTTVVADFSKAGTETWTITIHDGSGAKVGEFGGKNTRKAK